MQENVNLMHSIITEKTDRGGNMAQWSKKNFFKTKPVGKGESDGSFSIHFCLLLRMTSLGIEWIKSDKWIH